jgi:site-specific recombinase XerD
MRLNPFTQLCLRLVDEDLVARRLEPSTRHMMVDGVRRFLSWASRRSTPDPRAFRKRDLMGYHGWLTRQISCRSGDLIAPGTVALRFRAVSLLYSCLYRAGIVPDNPAQGLCFGSEHTNYYKRRPLTRDEITRFLESIETSTPLGLRDRTLFELVYSSGLRVSEAAGLKVADINFDERLMVVRGKFDRDRMVPISQVAHDFLLTYLGKRRDRPEVWVFPGYRGHLAGDTVSERFQCRWAAFEKGDAQISTHSIRHSTATHLLENGASIRHVQELLGHANIESTARYTHVMVDSLARVYHRYHPREHEYAEHLDEGYEKKLARLRGGE